VESRKGPRTTRKAWPSWQTEPCPSWCTRLHREDDHPEDRLHQDDGVVFPAVVGRLDGTEMRLTPELTEMLVRRSRAFAHSAPTWLTIGELELGVAISLAVEFVGALRDALP
jgi:hypothetical protein